MRREIPPSTGMHGGGQHGGGPPTGGPPCANRPPISGKPVRHARAARRRTYFIFVVPLTATARSFPSHVEVDVDEGNGLDRTSWAQVEQLRAVATERCGLPIGNVGPGVTHQMLDILAMITGMP